MRKINLICLLALSALSFGMTVEAVPISWTDWTSANSSTATGIVQGVTVTFTGAQSPSSQTSGGINYWATNSSIYRAPGIVDNGPEASSDIIRITDSTTYTLEFSQAVIDPVMAILSLGRTNLHVRYDFEDDFDILNSGTGYWGGASTGSLFEETGNVLRGEEGHGIIQFHGTFTSISWTANPAEFWHGFQIGIADVSHVTEPISGLLLGLGLIGFCYRNARKTKR